MIKLLIISDTVAAAHDRAKALGYPPSDVKTVRSIDDIRGFRNMLMAYAGEPYMLDDWDEILEYAISHEIVALKTTDGGKSNG